MVKVAVLGHFGFGKDLLNGQTIKTKNVANAITDVVGEKQVLKIDTHGGIKSFLKLPFQIFSCLRNAENIVIMPAHRGVRIISPLLLAFNRHKKRVIHYVVIGGWLPSLCAKKPKLAKIIKKIDYIYVETSTMKTALEKQGFLNVVVMPNFKHVDPLDVSELNYRNNEPYMLCTFSRVMKEKGIEDAINAVKSINLEYNRIVFKLDIYGQIDSSQLEWFESLSRDFPQFIQYKGPVPSNKTIEIVKKYFALLFPTKFYTEGIPGTILDAYASGVPVISSRWENFSDLIDDGKTGIGYEFNNLNDLISILKKVTDTPSLISGLRVNCLKKAMEYSSSNVIKCLVSRFDS